jgi:hypothetical protein
MNQSVVTVVLILIVSLALWSLFKIADAPLDPAATSVVVGLVAVVVVWTRWLIAARRQRGKNRS